MIAVRNLTVRSGTFRLANVSLEVPTGAYCVLMGATGSGKTTLLESILGLRNVEAGTVLLGGVDVTKLDPAARGIGYVPQDGALFSRMTVREHLGFALEVRRASPAAIHARTAALAGWLGLEGLLERRPRNLSGGERQRVALGRALAFQPQVLCLDEPLSALDSETRGQMCRILRDVQRQTGVTTLHVTHNLDEAEQLADCMLRIDGGQIRDMGTRQTSRAHRAGLNSAENAAAAPGGRT